MDGRLFLAVARSLSAEDDEASLRTAAGRAYYALFLEARDARTRWGLAPVGNVKIHGTVREQFERTGDSSLEFIATRLRELFQLRAQADYENAIPGPFESHFVVEEAVRHAEDAINLLLEIDDEPARRKAAIAAIRRMP